MKRRANPTLIGGFVVGGLVLVAAGILAATGGALFKRSDRAVMHFSGSIYGLRVGAPVVFRGVDVGQVIAVGVVYDEATGEFSIPVEAELERDAIRSVGGEQASSLTVGALVAKGLRAQLSMQSLLTGQLYVDLDLRPERPARLLGRTPDGAVEIPTTPTTIQALKQQLEELDVRALVDDISAIAGSARAVIAGPELKKALADVAEIAASARRLSGTLERRSGPLLQGAQGTLAEATRAAAQLAAAAERVNDTARRLGDTAGHVNALVAPDAPLVTDVRRTAAELAETAASLRRHTGDDAALVRHLDETLVDLSRAARTLRELATLLDRHPEALLRGRATTPTPEEAADAPSR